ncbi:efflux transporter, hydrophobe/amphiphile efflux-3 (HAE3) family [Ferroglobus placidus DSM 10642]|uniref:Efflux transporter, hydrophobe/amphiphile efflux-3 (HAE3) family n=1 Tax=Ferroglobus placidus (strain DSM 10642 / AEDII12DO) TaxID=589924 RepID=D3S0K3_FERPA|nr:hydrophobe/amphiphile efflux-3 (HAE3) family transporter [Ferroglobus placidus]ADC66244.1 efflux transporter, hydrophobe/amphiphile efflux-3 (HAE3) family [Ferroglobus placidus DSM 10642]
MKAETILKFRHLIIFLAVLFFLLSGYNAKNVKMNQGYETYFSEDYKEFKQYKLYSKDFGGSVASVYVFVKGDDVINYETYELLLKIGDELRKVGGIGEVKSAAHSIVSRLGYLPTEEKVLQSLTYQLAPQYVPKRSLAIVEAEVTADPSRYEQMAKEIEDRLSKLDLPPGVVVEATGNPMIRYQVSQSISGSMRAMGIAAIVLMVVTLSIVFRGVVEQKRYLFFPLLISIITVSYAYGMMPVLDIPLTEVTNAFLPVLIGLSIEYAAQFMGRYEEERRKGLSSFEAAAIAIRTVSRALSLALITTVIGFLSMLFSGVPALGWFGLISAIGLIFAFLLSMTFLPAILVLTDRKERKKALAGIAEKTLDFLAILTSRKYKAVLLLSLVVASVSYYGYEKVPLETNFYKYIPQDLPAIRKFNELQSIFGSQDRIILVTKIDSVSPEEIKKVEELAKYVVKSESKIIDYNSIGKILENRFGKIGENSYELENQLEMLGDYKDRYISGNTLAVYFTVAEMDWLEFKDLYERVKREVSFFGGFDYYLTGDVVLKMFVADLIINGQNRMTMASYALVVLLLLLVYRSLKNAVVPLIPITLVILTTGGVMYALGFYRTLVTASMNSMIIGLGIDFSIHVMERYIEERKRFDPEKAVEITITRIGKPILTSGLTMAGGFAAMLISPFPIMRDFGIISVLAILMSLIAALTVVPAFLVFVDRRKAS